MDRTSVGSTRVRTSLIICTRNRPELLADTVRSIFSGSRLPDELIIMDQSDCGHRAEQQQQWKVPRNCELRHIYAESRGLSRARNEAIGLAQHPIVMFTDDDVLVTSGWLDGLLDPLAETGPRTVVTGRVLPAAEEGGASFVPTLKGGWAPASYSGRITVDPLVTFNMALYRSAYLEVGGFDEELGPGTRFPAGEDNEFAHRLLSAGFSIVYLPDAIVYHRAWRQAREYVPLRWRYGRGQGAFFAKHLRLQDGFMLRRLAGTVVRHVLAAPQRLWQRGTVPGRRLPRRTLAFGDVALLAGVIVGAVDWVVTRSRTSRGDGTG